VLCEQGLWKEDRAFFLGIRIALCFSYHWHLLKNVIPKKNAVADSVATEGIAPYKELARNLRFFLQFQNFCSKLTKTLRFENFAIKEIVSGL